MQGTLKMQTASGACKEGYTKGSKISGRVAEYVSIKEDDNTQIHSKHTF